MSLHGLTIDLVAEFGGCVQGLNQYFEDPLFDSFWSPLVSILDTFANVTVEELIDSAHCQQ